MISATGFFINCQVGGLNNESIIDHWKSHNIHMVDISGHRNQCLQYLFNALYHDIKVAAIL